MDPRHRNRPTPSRLPTGYERGGPVILFLGGPSSKFNYQTRLSQFVKYSNIFQATFLLLEHRFYGISVPAGGDAPFSASNLEYLTVEQALLDTQAFVEAFQAEQMPDGTKWILAGEADSASLAAWCVRGGICAVPQDAAAAAAARRQTTTSCCFLICLPFPAFPGRAKELPRTLLLA